MDLLALAVRTKHGPGYGRDVGRRVRSPLPQPTRTIVAELAERTRRQASTSRRGARRPCPSCSCWPTACMGRGSSLKPVPDSVGLGAGAGTERRRPLWSRGWQDQPRGGSLGRAGRGAVPSAPEPRRAPTPQRSWPQRGLRRTSTAPTAGGSDIVRAGADSPSREDRAGTGERARRPLSSSRGCSATRTRSPCFAARSHVEDEAPVPIDSCPYLAGLRRGPFGWVPRDARLTLCRELARTPLDEGTAEKWQELADGLISDGCALQ